MVSGKTVGLEVGKWRIRLLGCAGVFAVFFGLPALFVIASSWTILYDPNGQVREAWLLYGNGRKEFSKMPLGPYFVYVDGDAGIEILCNDGRRSTGGYVTGMLADDYAVVGDCEIGPN